MWQEARSLHHVEVIKDDAEEAERRRLVEEDEMKEIRKREQYSRIFGNDMYVPPPTHTGTSRGAERRLSISDIVCSVLKDPGGSSERKQNICLHAVREDLGDLAESGQTYDFETRRTRSR